MSEESKETLNKVDQKENSVSATTQTEIKYKLVNNAPDFYLACIKHFKKYSKGEIFTQEQICEKLQEIFENYE
tara:strand:+ start:475 stop:693 length:219 start_codon:yes stop_codon:yes gene_type:complete